MSREIKFRAWDNGTKEMLFTGFHVIGEVTAFGGIEQHISENMLGAKSSIERWNDIELMQYTGIKDKKGEEIYEGDIVVIPDDPDPANGSPNALCVVVYAGTQFCYKDIYNESLTPISDLIGLSDEDEDAEVIGNICENPELLTP